MIIFSIYDDGSVPSYYPTKSAAIDAARIAIADDPDLYPDGITVRRSVVAAITKETLIDIINSNGGCWEESSAICAVVDQEGGVDNVK